MCRRAARLISRVGQFQSISASFAHLFGAQLLSQLQEVDWREASGTPVALHGGTRWRLHGLLTRLGPLHRTKVRMLRREFAPGSLTNFSLRFYINGLPVVPALRRIYNSCVRTMAHLEIRVTVTVVVVVVDCPARSPFLQMSIGVS